MAFNDPSNFDMNDFVNDDDFHSPSYDTSSPSLSQMNARSSTFNGRRPSDSQTGLYSAPSHDYGQHRQQTGLPPDAMSSVAAANSFHNPFPAATAGLEPQRYNSYNDFDMGFGTNSSTFMFPSEGHLEPFVDPTAIDTPQVWSNLPSQQSKTEHSEKQPRKEQQQLPSLLMGQTPSSRTGSIETANDISEAHANDQISRLLKQMRQSSTTSTLEDDNFDTSESQTLAKLKKDEDEMDEDERLLASEQGKKLTSKERRQLRNKVSARAFRSRRKEYIGQLESEVSSKADEITELKQRMRALMEQNHQLTQLTRVFLGHPAFQAFMDDLSRDRQVLDRLIAETSASQNENRSQQSQVKQEPTRQPSSSAASRRRGEASGQSQEQALHVGMSMMPDTNLDLSGLNLGNQRFQPSVTHFNPSNAGYAGAGFQGHQVFAVFDVPAGPSMGELASARNLSGKSELPDIRDFVPEKVDDAPKSLVPSSYETPNTPAVDQTSTVELDSNEPAYELYSTSRSCRPATNDLPSSVTSLVGLNKPSFELQICSSNFRTMDDTTAFNQVKCLFASTEAACERVDKMTAHFS